MAKTLRTLIAACTTRIRNAGREIQLFPAGLFRARDGRPEKLEGWIMNAEVAQQVIRLASLRQTPFVVDYEHQTLHAETSGQPAPAAGWFTKLEWREGDGLYAIDVEWTERARAMIEADEYRYLSPVFGFNPNTGEVRELLMAAVTNTPAIDGIADLAAARYSFDDQREDTHVDEETLKLLGLSKDATEEQINQAVAALKAKADKAGALEQGQTALKTKAENLEQEVAALKAGGGSGEPDPSKYVSVQVVKDLQSQVAALSTRMQGSEVDQLVKTGLDDGRLIPSMEDWARKLGEKDVAQLRAYLDNAQPIAALTSSQTQGNPPQGGDSKLSADELAVCKQLGLTEKEFLEHKGAE
jgi:phage I-like protein